MKKLLRLVVFNFIFVLLLCNKIFAYRSTSFKHVYKKYSVFGSENNSFYYQKNLLLSNVNVNMTQDDIYYYFNITANVNLDVGLQNKIEYKNLTSGSSLQGSKHTFGDLVYYTGADKVNPSSLGETVSLIKNRLQPMLYGKENFTDKEIHRQANYEYTSASDYYTFNHYLYVMDEIVSKMIYKKEYDSSSSRSDNARFTYSEKKDVSFYIPHPIKEMNLGFGTNKWYNEETGLYDIEHKDGTSVLKNSDGFTLISNNCNLVSYTLDSNNKASTAVYNLNTDIKIEKSKYINYRYLAYGGLVFITNYDLVNDTYANYTGVFASSNTIDLGLYANCDHDWSYSIIANNATHTKYCNKCEWTVNENHNYKYEYDGLANNLCECGHNKYVNYKFIIKDDTTTEKSEKPLSNSTYTKHLAGAKTGYVFNGYNVKEKQIDGNFYDINLTPLKEVDLGTITELPDMTGEYSKTFTAIYKPITYKVKYSNINNMGLTITETIEDQSFTYDVAGNLKTGKSVTGYLFKGWSNVSGSSTIKYNGNASVKNLSNVNNATITLYPVYEAIKYVITYSSYNKYGKTIAAISDQEVSYGAKVNLKPANQIVGYTFIGWTKTKDNKTADYTDKQAVQNLTTTNAAKIILYPIYEPIKWSFKFSNTNNLSITLTTTIPNQVFTYDVSQNIKDGQTVNGYTFKGWSLTEKGNEVKYKGNASVKNHTTTNNAVITLYPVYEPNHYIIKYSNYNKYGKTIPSIENQNIAFGVEEKLKVANQIVGYKFKGWSKTKDSEIIDFTDEQKVINLSAVDKAEITLFPIYEPIKYQIVFNKDNNVSVTIPDIQMENEIFLYDEKKNLTVNKYNIKTFYFEGWTKTKGSEIVDFENMDEILNLTHTDNEIINLYPVYSKWVYTIKLKYPQEDKELVYTISNVIKDEKTNFPNFNILPIGQSGFGFYYGENKCENSLDVDKFIISNNQIIELYYNTNGKIISLYEEDIELKYNIECFYPCEKATKSILIKDVVFGTSELLPKLNYFPLDATIYWFYEDVKVNTTLDLEKFVKYNNEKINIYIKSDKDVSCYEKNVSIFYNIEFLYRREKATESIIYKDINIGENREFPKMKALPLDKNIEGFFVNDILVNKTTDVEKFIRKNNETIIVVIKPNDDSISCYEKSVEFLYTINLKFRQDNVMKNHKLSNVKIGVKTEFPKFNILPEGKEGGGFKYNNIKCENSLDVDKFVTKNHEEIELVYDENGQMINLYEDNIGLKYDIECFYPCEKATKSILIKDIVFGTNELLPKLCFFPLDADIAWYYEDTKVVTTLDLEKFVKYNGEKINIYIKSNKDVSCYEEDVSISYNIEFLYRKEKATESIIYKNILIGEDREFPKIKTLPLDKSIEGFFVNDIKVNNTKEIEKFITKNNETIKVIIKPNDDTVNCYEEDVAFTYTINLHYNQEGKELIYKISDVKIGENMEFPLFNILPLGKIGKGWFYANWLCNNTFDVDKFIEKNNQIIDLVYDDDGQNLSLYENGIELSYDIEFNYNTEGQNKIIKYENVKVGENRELLKLKCFPLSIKEIAWYYGDTEVKNTLDIEKLICKNQDNIKLEVRVKDEGSNEKEKEEINYYEDDLELKYNIEFIYRQEKQDRSIVYKDVKIGENRKFPNLKILPLDKKIEGFFINDVQVMNTLDVGKFVKKNNETILVYVKPNDDSISCYKDDVSFTYVINFIYENDDKEEIYNIKNVRVGEKVNFNSFKKAPYNVNGFAWFYDDEICENSLQVDKYITKNNQIVNLYERDLKYKFYIQYETNDGHYSNNRKTLKKEYLLNEGFNKYKLERASDYSSSEVYFEKYICNNIKIKTFDEVRALVTENDEVMIVKEYQNRPGYTGAEKTDDGKSPKEGGGFTDKKNSIGNENINGNNVDQGENKNKANNNENEDRDEQKNIFIDKIKDIFENKTDNKNTLEEKTITANDKKDKEKLIKDDLIEVEINNNNKVEKVTVKEKEVQDMINDYLLENPELKKTYDLEDVEIHNMTSTELNDMYMLLGLNVATFSNARLMKNAALGLRVGSDQFTILVISLLFLIFAIYESYIIYQNYKKH